MNPIFTVSNEKGMNGYWYDTFVQQFDNICKMHLSDKRAKKFAFIIFDFQSSTHFALQKQGVFSDLDRLSGKDISIFYLDGQLNEKQNKQNKLFQNLNEIVTGLSNQSIKSIPFILFFDFFEGDVVNFKCYPIRDNVEFILNDLTVAISKELEALQEVILKKKKNTFNNFFNETPKIVYTEFVKLALKGIFEVMKSNP